ncbi:MAG: hypothetical protein ACREP8_08865, partial [Candidatus Binatia bacterium]
LTDSLSGAHQVRLTFSSGDSAGGRTPQTATGVLTMELDAAIALGVLIRGEGGQLLANPERTRFYLGIEPSMGI